MRIRTPTDLGALIRDHRNRLGLDQKSLAEKVGVSRQWIVEVEQGKPRAEIGLLLRTISALGIALDAETGLRKSQKIKAHLTVWMRTSISTPSLTPRAGKENDPGTHCHS